MSQIRVPIPDHVLNHFGIAEGQFQDSALFNFSNNKLAFFGVLNVQLRLKLVF